MKKFSKISKEEIPFRKKEKEIVKETDTDLDLLKSGVRRLMDQYLGIQMYGPVTRHERAGSVKVVGQEIFLEALVDFLEEFTSKDKIKALESLKYSITDWKLIDDKIEGIKESSSEVSDSKLVLARKKVKYLIDKFKDINLLKEYLDHKLVKVENLEKAESVYLVSKKMNTNNDQILSLIESSYLKRMNELKSI
jgi:hypothetical protein